MGYLAGVKKWFTVCPKVVIDLQLLLETAFGKALAGRLLIDGIGSFPKSMSTVGLEFSSFINPKLTWKTVSKGRSTLRRSRRPFSRNSKMGREQNQGSKRVESQGYESGKITGITRRFNDSMEHIPIKKRRFLFRSPSPPPQSPHEKSGELENNSCMSEQPITAVPQKVETNSSNVEMAQDAYDSSFDGKILKTTDGVYGCGEDFSGIEILAAAACIDMLDKPSANTTRSTIDESVSKRQNKLLELHQKVADSSRTCVSAKCQTSEGTKACSARDDRLHWDLNTPMDEWDHPLDDTVVNTATKLDNTTVGCSLNKEHSSMQTIKESTPQPSTSGMNTSEALSSMTENASGTELAQMKNCHTGKHGVITGETLSELVDNNSGFHLNVQEYVPGPSSCMKGGIEDSDNSHVQVVDRVETVDHCLHLGYSKTLLAEGKSMATVSDLQHATLKGSTSAMQVDSEKGETDLVLETVPVEANCAALHDACEVIKNSTEPMESDVKKEGLQEHHVHPFQHNPTPPENQELALSHVRAPEDAVLDSGSNNIPHLKDTKDPGELPEFIQVETEVNNACDRPSEARLPDAKECESKSMRAPELEERTSNIHSSNCNDMVKPEKRSDLAGTSSNVDDAFQPVVPYAGGSESAIVESKVAGVSSYISNSEDMGASASVDDEKFAKSACGVETKDEFGIDVGRDALMHKNMENTSVKEDNDQVTAPSNHLEKVSCEDSSDHVLQLHVPHEDSSQVVTNGLEGGYDSYLEDGELRESVEHGMVDNDGENRESEHVDYDSDNRDEYEFTDAANEPIAEKVVEEVGCEKKSDQLHEPLQCEGGLPSIQKNIEEENSYPRQDSFLAESDTGVDCLKGNPSTATSNSTFIAQLSSMDNPEVVDMDLDDGRKSSIISDDLKEDENDGFEDIRDVHMKGVEMKDSRRELHSRIEGPSDRRVTDTAPRNRYSTLNHTYYRNERQIGVDESLGRSRSLHIDYGGRPGSHYWNHGLRSVVANPATEGSEEKFFGPSDDTSLRARRQGMFSATRGRYNHLVRAGSPDGRDEEYGMGLVKVRDVTSESSQRNSSFDRRLSGMSRGYRRPIHETPNSSSSIPNHFIRRERGFSPGGSRIGPYPPRSHRRSRSRSRTRSPDLRPDGRMGRTRMQYQTADYFRERRSPLFCPGPRFETTSGRLRSENCRPVSRPVRFMDVPPSGRAQEYENEDDYKRKTYLPRSHRSRSRSCSPEFRSEARMGTMRLTYPPSSNTGDHVFRPGKRFDTMGSPGRLRSDDYVRPITRPVRFHDASQPNSRDNEYDGDGYRRKSRTIFDRIHPKRSYDIERDDRRFDYDTEDGVAAQSFRRGDVYMRGVDRRSVDDVVRGAREERSNVRYNSDRIYSNGPKPFAIREYNDDALPRHVRPE